MSKLWIIDGHNVMHRSRLLRSLLKGQACDAAQKRLIEQARLFHDFGGDSVIVVFDSRYEKSISDKWHERQKRTGINILYGSADEQADTLVERNAVEAKSLGKTVFVVTEDRAVCHTVEAAGAFSMGVTEFEARIDSIEKQQSRAVMKKSEAADDDFRNELPL